MTKARQAIKLLLDKAEKPLSALDLGQGLEGLCDLATVYRSLHYLEEKGFAESFVLHCSAHGTERYYVSREAPHRHWFHCERCHRFVDLGACRIGPLLKSMEADAGVQIRHHALYATGLCEACSEKQVGRSPAEEESGVGRLTQPKKGRAISLTINDTIQAKAIE
ncbi:MAG: transcriptional repressor [Spirochaetia bacterium]|jgi:Fur family ferric uptake transcriptional regulator|nr:transcriptional repressor [Spirochaetia bacterium]